MNLKTNNYFVEEFKKYDDSDERYRLANQLLYKIVKDYPDNTDAHHIVTKFWIIGRTYAAAIERRNNKADTPGDFYYEYVAPAIADSELDKKISDIKKKHKELTDEALRDVLSLHGYLVKLIKGITKKEKRSLASKYLHFHLPELVLIYDSRVASVIGKFINGRTNGLKIEKDWDKVYAIFAYKAYEIYKTLKKERYASKADTLTRVVDTFLLRYCDEHNVEGQAE